jgi:hypothetical protein
VPKKNPGFLREFAFPLKTIIEKHLNEKKKLDFFKKKNNYKTR